ncbi:MAG: PKD domain-containing protein, partial [Cyclobacteriaceae bacterium]|nr:PKD domain-containing protein [Cyclobacteriaceae bacterium]
MDHVNQNGCPLSQSENYTVYDHTFILPKLTNSNTSAPSSKPDHITKIGLRNDKYLVPSDVEKLAGKELGKAGPIGPKLPFNYDDIAGYEMDSLIVRIPLEATPKGEGKVTDQIIYGSDWTRQLQRLLTGTQVGDVDNYYASIPYRRYFRNYTWDYSHILNAVQESLGESGLMITRDPYSHFKLKTPKDSSYYTGGSLGFINFIGRFRNTADNSLYQPLIQQVELFVPPIPIIETTGESFIIPAEGSKPAIYVFCELGSDFQLRGYPQAIAGSSGTFRLFDAATDTPLVVTGGFTDGLNGIATFSPKNADNILKNGNRTIRVEYTYQDDNSPIAGVGKFYIQIAPNPIARFELTSNGLNASAPTAYCVDNQIDFNASSSSIGGISPIPETSVYIYVWDFGDPNSGIRNEAKEPKPSHIFSVSSTYPVSLNIISKYGCTSTTEPLASVRTVPLIKNIVVGEIPNPRFTFAESCVGDPMMFDASTSALPSGSSSIYAISKYIWDFDYSSAVAPPNPNPPSPKTITANSNTIVNTTYSQAGFYTVRLTTVSNVAGDEGCKNSVEQQIAQLPKVVPTQAASFNEDFRLTNGGWLSIDLSGAVPTKGGSWDWNPATPGQV